MHLRLSRLAFVLTAALVLSTVGVRADIWVAPLPQGSNVSGDGTESNPYATISHAYAQTTQLGETIRAKPGQYFDVVSVTAPFEVTPGVFIVKWAHIVADNPNPASTEIIGDFVNPVVTIAGSGGSLQGFSITGGADSGVRAYGNVSVINNIIHDNTGEFGGGMRYEPDTCTYGPSVVNIIGNTFSNNQADGDGGGLHVSAGVNDANCQVSPVSILIEGNSFVGNIAGDDGGGLQAQTDTFPSIQFADITVRDNDFSGNSCDDEGGRATRRSSSTTTRSIRTSRWTKVGAWWPVSCRSRPPTTTCSSTAIR